MAICFCGICIPYSAVFALVAMVMKPLVSVLVQWGILPLWMTQKFGIYTEMNQNKKSCCDASVESTHEDTRSDSSSTSHGTITLIHSQNQFNDIISSNGKVIVKFTATWCKPCKMIHPIYEKLALENTSIHFCSVDVDELDDVAGALGISVMPTFALFHHGNKKSYIQGASQLKLQAFVSEAVSLS